MSASLLLSPGAMLDRLTNGTFETGALTPWSNYDGGTPTVTAAIDPAGAFFGQYGVKATRTASTGHTGIIQNSVPFIPGKTYTLSCWINPSVATSNAVLMADITLPVYTLLISPNTSLAANTWQRMSFTFTFPPGTPTAGAGSDIYISMGSGTTSGQFCYIDQVRLEQRDITPLELVGGSTVALTSDSADGIWPIPTWDEEYAESPDTEGALRTRSRPQNITTTGKVLIQGNTQAALNANVLLWEQVIEACRRNGGTLVYTPTNGQAVTFTLRSAFITTLPEVQPQTPSNLYRLSEFSLVFAPFGNLAPVTLPTLASSLPMFSMDLGDRAFSSVVAAQCSSGGTFGGYWRLGSGGTTDQSGQGRNLTAGGGVTVGSATGLLPNDPDTATTFDGVDDRFTSGYSTAWNDVGQRTYWGLANRTSSATNDCLIAGGGGVSAPSLTLLSGGNDVRYRIQDNSALGTLSATWAGAWPGNGVTVFWTLITDLGNDRAELYINGVSKGVVTGLTGTLSTPGNFQVGAVGTAFSDPFLGVEDELGVFESRLRPEQIWQLYQATKVRQAIPGSADALVQVTLTDLATQARDHVELGIQDLYDYTARQKTLFSSVELTIAGYSGTANTRTGAWDPATYTSPGATVRSTLLTNPQALAATPTLLDVGRFRVKVRVYGRGTGPIYVRASSIVGSQQPVGNPWVQLPFVNPTSDLTSVWYELDLGLVTIPAAAAGTQQAVVQLEAYSSTQNDTLDINLVELVPASRYGKARAPFSWIIGAASGSDAFNQTAGALTGKTADLGGNWATAGSGAAPDLTVDATAHNVTRNSSGDTSGRYGYLAAAFTNVQVQADVQLSSVGVGRVGVHCRYTTASGIGLRAWIQQGFLFVEKVTAGPTITTLASITSANYGIPGGWYTIALAADQNGGWSCWVGKQGGGLPVVPVLGGWDADLLTGGALQTGQAGIFDQNPVGVVGARAIDNFSVWAPTRQHVISSGGSVRIDHQQALRNDSGVYSPVPSYEGLYLKAHPGEVSRLAVKARRADVDYSTDVGTTDLTQLDVTVTPRVHLLG